MVAPLIATLRRWPRPPVIAVAFFGMVLLPAIFLPWRWTIWTLTFVVGGGYAFALATLASAVTMAACFGIARLTRLHDRVERGFGEYGWFKAFMFAVKDAKPWKVVFLLRLSPVPYAALNWFAALSPDVTFWPYIAASIVGHAPDNAMHVFVGQGIASLGDLIKGKVEPTPGRIAAVAVPFAAAVVLAILSIWYGRRAVARVKAQAEAAGMPAEELDGVGDGGESGSGSGSGAARPKPPADGVQPVSAPAAS